MHARRFSNPPKLTGVVAVGVDVLHSRLDTRSFFALCELLGAEHLLREFIYNLHTGTVE